jgi:hypothetical protein
MAGSEFTAALRKIIIDKAVHVVQLANDHCYGKNY